MKNPQEWWNGIKYDERLIIEWLKNQYHGEITASEKMLDFIYNFGNEASNPLWLTTVAVIASQERQHAKWIGQLLINRSIKPEVLIKEERYWNENTPTN